MLFIGTSITLTPDMFVKITKADPIIIYVPDDYSTIQAAVDNANDEDTIVVRDGTYIENVDVNKQLIIQSEHGLTATIVQAANFGDNVFEVTLSNVSLIGFTIQGSTSNAYNGIRLINANNCTITHNYITNNYYGIYLYNSNYNKINNNNISNNNELGLIIQYNSCYNDIEENIINNNHNGIIINYESNYNTFVNNMVSYYSLWGHDGISIGSSSNNLFDKNTISYCFHGVCISSSYENQFYRNNFINNDIDVNYYSGANVWNSTEPFTYQYDGQSYISQLGNYWDDYQAEDNNGDGIGDTYYTLNVQYNQIDYYPLMEPFDNYFFGGNQPSNQGYEVGIGFLGFFDEQQNTYDQPQRKLARTSDGVLHCVYNRSNSGHSQIYHSYSNNNGETWSEEQLTSESYDQTLPVIVTDSHDFLHVVWRGCHVGSPNHPQIRYRKYTTQWNTISNITSDTNWDQTDPVIAIDSQDNLHVVWSKVDALPYTKGPIHYSKYTTSWSTPVLIGQGYGYVEEYPSLVIDKYDYVHVAWSEGGYFGQGCWHSAYRRYTTFWESIESFECLTRAPYLAVDNQGTVHLVNIYHPMDPNFDGLLYRKRTASGWESPITIAPVTDGTKQPSIAVDSNDYVHVVWNDNGNIIYRKFTSSWQPSETIISDTDSCYPNLIWSWYPVVNGVHPNRPQNGYAFVWNDGATVRFYKSPDLVWDGGGNQPPSCIVELQKNGVPINEINVGEEFDICLSEYSGNIKQVRFLSDENQNGIVDEGYTWTDWYDWDISMDDWTGLWDHEQKIKTWTFVTIGAKEVWVEVNDAVNSKKCFDIVSVIFPYIILFTPLHIDEKDSYTAGDTLNAYFSIKNIGDNQVNLNILTVGGRDSNGVVVDFTWKENIVLEPGHIEVYIGKIILPEKEGSFHFFCTYQTQYGYWNPCIDLGDGLSDEDRTKEIYVFENEEKFDLGGIIIPIEDFPEGNGQAIPIYIPDVNVMDGSNKIREENGWSTIWEDDLGDFDFDPDKIEITSLFTYWAPYVKDSVSHYRKIFPKAKITVGGIYASLMPDHCKNYTKCDEVYIGVNTEAEKYYPAYDLITNHNSHPVDYQIIHSSRGCLRKCSFCGTWIIESRFKAKKSIKDEIKKRKIVFYDNNLLNNPHIENILKELIELKKNRKISWCDSQSGFDGRLLIKKPKLAKLLKQAGFRYPRIAWDWGYKDYKDIKKQLDVLIKGGYRYNDIFVFMIYNWNIQFEEMEEKRIKCWEWKVQIADCRYRPLTQIIDNYHPRESQTSKDYYIHTDRNWTDTLVKQFRNNVRRQNICVRQGVNFYSKSFEQMMTKKNILIKTKKMPRDKVEKLLNKLGLDYWYPEDITYPKDLSFLKETSNIPNSTKINQIIKT